MSSCPCSRPTAGWLCSTCIAGFMDDLAKVPEVMDRLEASKVGDTPRPTNGNSGPTGSKPPVNLTPVVIMLNIEVMINAMGGHVGLNPAGHPLRPIKGSVEIITDRINRLAALPCIVSYQAQLTTELANADKYLNPEAPTMTLGPCYECQTPITATEQDHETRCTTCGTTYTINTYRTLRVLEALGNDGTPVRASTAVRTLNKAGLTITPQNVKDWLRRGRLYPAAIDEHARHLYNIQDIYLLAMHNQSPQITVDTQ